MEAANGGHRAQPVAGEAVEPGCSGAGLASPIITAGSGLFEAEGRPYVVRMELPVSAAEMVAALYADHDRLRAGDLEDDELVWRCIALVVVQDGLNAVEHLARLINTAEADRVLAAPEWLALCRKRVAEVTAGPPGAPLA